MPRSAVVLLVVGLGLALAMLASASGWLGLVQVCGADRGPGCIAWPRPISVLIWAGFVIGVAALVIWQLRYLDR